MPQEVAYELLARELQRKHEAKEDLEKLCFDYVKCVDRLGATVRKQEKKLKELREKLERYAQQRNDAVPVIPATLCETCAFNYCYSEPDKEPDTPGTSLP